MDTARLIPPRLPLTTLSLGGVAAAVMALPALQAALIYSRAAIDGGEVWRLATGNLVHLSPPHFYSDVAALLVIGTLIELRPHRHFAVLCAASAALIGLALYALAPGILLFGGLSGIVTAAVVFFCLHGLREPGARRWIYWTTLVCLLAKIGGELISGSSVLLLADAGQDFVPVPLSHAVGAATALLLFVVARRPGVRPTPASRPSGG